MSKKHNKKHKEKHNRRHHGGRWNGVNYPQFMLQQPFPYQQAYSPFGALSYQQAYSPFGTTSYQQPYSPFGTTSYQNVIYPVQNTCSCHTRDMPWKTDNSISGVNNIVSNCKPGQDNERCWCYDSCNPGINNGKPWNCASGLIGGQGVPPNSSCRFLI